MKTGSGPGKWMRTFSFDDQVIGWFQGLKFSAIVIKFCSKLQDRRAIWRRCMRIVFGCMSSVHLLCGSVFRAA